MRTSTLAIFVAALALPQTASAQSAWTRDQGSGYVNLSFTRLSADRIYGTDFEAREIGDTYSQSTVGLYGELGLVDRWLTATIDAQLFRRNEIANQGATQGLGDLRLGLWSGLIEAPVRVTVGVQVGLPLGDDRPTAGGGADFDAEFTANSLPTGDGEFDVEPQVIVGHSFGGDAWPLQHFATARVGVWARTRGFSPALTYQLELGTKVPVTVLDRFWLITRVRGVESTASQADIQSGLVGLGNGVTYTALSVELFARIWDQLGAAVTYETAPRARVIAAGAPLKFALSYAF